MGLKERIEKLTVRLQGLLLLDAPLLNRAAENHHQQEQRQRRQRRQQRKGFIPDESNIIYDLSYI